MVQYSDIKKNNLPLVSTITPVLNGSKYIAENLKSIKKQSYPSIEIIVVDNFSTDNTVSIAKKYTSHVYKKGPERASQDNYGVQKAKGKYIFITGCDMVLDKDYIKQCVAKCEEEGFDAIYASVRSKTVNFWSKVKGMERDMYIGDDLIESARFFKRDVFLKLGGYDTTMVIQSDDFDMQRRMNNAGYKTGRVSAVETHIDEIDSLKEIFAKSFYYGMNSWIYIKRNPKYAAKQLMPIRQAFIRNYRMLLQNPLLSIGLVLFKVVQYGSASIGLLMGIVDSKKLSDYFHSKIYAKGKTRKK